ncbi:MAG: HAD family phosphatase [Nanoarchaeota archaeon]|nr:HAD family phosphatase [Nanoarchaeota archaeon]MBU4284310.1 HAD family phosphatase [Nanoarchaeota archaeon]
MRKDMKAIIFDFDGVLVNSEWVKFNCLTILLKKRGLHLFTGDFKIMVGLKTSVFLSKKFKDKLSQNQIEEISKERQKDQLRHVRLYAKPIPGVKQFICQLQRRKLELCLATGTQRKIVNNILGLIGLKNAFHVMVTGEEFKSSKPDPEVYILSLKKLGVPRRDVIVIEDSAAGVAAAKKAGLYCIAITTTQTKSELKEADLVVPSFRKLKNALRI